MKIGTSQIMNSIDRACIERLGIPMIVMMENAALKAFKNMETDKYCKYVIVCGGGNNGGDGFALARHLFVSGKSLDVFLASTSGKLSECCKINYEILKNMGIKIKKINNYDDVNELRDIIIESDVTVDAIFGTGLDRKVEGVYEAVIAVINENSKRTFSLDIPSGLDANNGNPLGNAVRANKTITFQMFKRGFINYESGKYIGDVVVEEIGIPSSIIDEFHNHEFITEIKEIRDNIRKREKYHHKGDYGRTLIVAGTKGFTGAAFIATEAAVRSGSGLVTLGCSSEVQDILSSRITEAMTLDYSDIEAFDRQIQISSGIGVGPGMGNNEQTLQIIDKILEQAKCPVVIDADGINVLAEKLDVLKKGKGKTVITPHLGEMSRITGLSIDYIKENRLDVAKKFASQHGIVVLLKGYQTIVTNGSTTYVNPTGNSSMATGGMGDCLTGIIASFLAQGMDTLTAAYCGAFVHGYIGDRLSERMHVVNASHIIEQLSSGIKEILQQ